MADSSDVVMSKNQKKRARKKLKKAEEVTGESACGAGRETGEGVRVCAEEKPAVRDPVAELKLKLSEAKANQDHEAAQQLREELWTVRDEGPPSVSALATATQSAVQHEHLVTASSSDPLDKKMSRLKKKLKQIETLEERQVKGEKLEENQLTKLASKQEVLDEIAELEQILTENFTNKIICV